jgi:16S rRNA (guanine527-N7)-methyltransferase
VDQATIARLLQPYAVVSEDLLLKISMYIDLMLKWNSKVNLTAIRDPEEMVTRHFGESFFAAANLIKPEWQGTIIDVGSGAGFPGMPLAMYAPGAKVTLIESQGKKGAFLNEVVFALKLTNAKVFNWRAEQFSGTADLVTMRAVERFEKSLPVAVRLVSDGGKLALLIGSSQVQTAASLARQFTWGQAIGIPGGQSRVMLAGINKVKVE